VYHAAGRPLGVGPVAAEVSRRHRRARRQPLDVPLPRRRQRFVEVGDAEHQVALGRREHPEVGDVRVAARLHGESRGRRPGQVGGHDRGRAAKEREGRFEHAPEAYRDELLNPRAVLRFEHGDRVPASRSWGIDAQALARDRRSQRPPGREAIGNRGTWSEEPLPAIRLARLAALRLLLRLLLRFGAHRVLASDGRSRGL
jgi:hypothetical protein